MAKTRADLETELRHLDAQMETLKEEYPDDADFWPAFAGMADVILDAASADDFDYVNKRTDEILRKHGMALPPESP